MCRLFNNLSKKRGIKLTILKKNEIIKNLKDTEVIINTSPCGMKGYPINCALNKEELSNLRKDVVAIEAVYNPLKTPLLTFVESIGGKICPGVNMLVEQAVLSFEFAFGEKVSPNEKNIIQLEAESRLK